MVLWVFGYGSLIWNPGFEYDEKFIGFVKDAKRKFNVACIDHRGTPEHPARTLTLETEEGSICWGIALCIKGGKEREAAAMKYLERRECEYDLQASVDIYKELDDVSPAVKGALVFTSTPDKNVNSYYLGPAPLEVMARQIATAQGPCGNNRDYLFCLEKAVHDIGHPDEYVTEIANLVRKELEELASPKDLPSSPIARKSHLPLVHHLSSLKEAGVVNSS